MMIGKIGGDMPPMYMSWTQENNMSVINCWAESF